MSRRGKHRTVTIESFRSRLGLLSGVFRHDARLPEEDYMDIATHMYVMLDGVIYNFQEDPDDGYRSYLGDIVVCDSLMPLNVWMPPEEVMCRVIEKDSERYGNDNKSYAYREDRCQILELWSTKTNLCVLEVGTCYADDYYPSFVDAFHPQNMSINCEANNLFEEEK